MKPVTALHLAAWLMLISTVLADDPPAVRPSPVTEQEFSGGPYCGIYCLYAALQTEGLSVDFAQLVNSTYVSSYLGSSLADLQQAAKDHGAYAEPLEGLTAASLRAATHPMILHVRRPGYGMPHLHWVLFLGVEGDQARILDPPSGVEHYPFAEVLAVWDGTALVVSKEPISTLRVRFPAWVDYGVLCAFSLTGLWLLSVAIRKGRWSGSSLVRGSALAALSIALAMILHGISREGFWYHRTALAQVKMVHFQPQLRKLSLEEVAEALGRPDTTVIDARYPSAYRMGHLPKAINLPVYTGLPQRSAVMAQVPETNMVVVYCQSQHCPWGEQIAADLHFRGYRRVYVFPGGWVAWSKYARQRKEPGEQR